MLECWLEDPKDRPTFSQLRSKFSTLLLANIDNPYMVLEVDDAKAYYNVTEEELSEQRESVSSEDSDSSLKMKKGPPKKPLWSKPSDPYFNTPVCNEVVVTVELEAPHLEIAKDKPSASTEQTGEKGVDLSESESDGFDPYIKNKSSLTTIVAEEVLVEVQQPPQSKIEVLSQQLVSMSQPGEQLGGFSLSVLSEEKVSHHPPAKQTHPGNPCVDDPGRRLLLEDKQDLESKFSTIDIPENGPTEC